MESSVSINLEVEGGDHEYKYFLVEDEPTWVLGEWVGDPDRLITVEEDTVFNNTWGDKEEAVSVEEIGEAPQAFNLAQNYPNPFNPTTRIQYMVPEQGQVSLKVYDMLGQEVSTLVDQHHSAGQYEATFDGSGLSSGTYIYRLEAGQFSESRTMMLVK